MLSLHPFVLEGPSAAGRDHLRSCREHSGQDTPPTGCQGFWGSSVKNTLNTRLDFGPRSTQVTEVGAAAFAKALLSVQFESEGLSRHDGLIVASQKILMDRVVDTTSVTCGVCDASCTPGSCCFLSMERWRFAVANVFWTLLFTIETLDMHCLSPVPVFFGAAQT